MSEATVKALTDAIYDAYQDSGLLDELDNEQVYEVAHAAAQTIERTGIRIPQQEQIGVWCSRFEGFFGLSNHGGAIQSCDKPVWRDLS